MSQDASPGKPQTFERHVSPVSSAEPAEPQTLQRRVLSGVELKTLASNGGFAVDETTGNRMIEALEGVIDSLEARWSSLQQFQQRPPVSTTATARFVADHMVNTATDEQGLLTQLQQARAEFPTYIEAIKLAKANYRDQDQTTQTKLKSFDVGD